MKTNILILLLFPFLFITLSAGDTGKLSGKATDAQTGEALFGITVIVKGTTLGAATDAEGRYTINNIEPGTYTVAFTGIGYQKREFSGVRISSSFTTRLDAQMNSATLNLSEVVVIAEAPLVRKDLTSSQTVLDGAAIETLPVESVEQILSLQAGIVRGTGGELHIRGGRSNEIEYTINGVSVQNPFNNQKTVSIATNAIQELSVISGTFNAEYGNALSGVVNTITKEGSQQYRSYLSFYSGDYVSGKTDPFYNIDEIAPFNNLVAEGTFGGPVPLSGDMVSFFVSGRFNNDKGYLYGIRQHTIYDSVYKNPLNPNDIRVSSTGDYSVVPMSTGRDFNGTSKLTFKPLPTLKINYDVVYSQSKSQSYSHNLKYNPDANPTSYDWGLLNSVELRHTIGNNTFYSLKGSYNFSDYKYYLFPLLDANNKEVSYYPGLGTASYHADPRYQPDYKSATTVSVYTFNQGGTVNNQYYQRAKTTEGKFDLTSQLNQNHEIKFGLQGKKHVMDYETFDVLRDSTQYRTPTILGPETPRHDLYTREPIQFSAYVQDKMEFESIIMNIGVRYDYFNAKAKHLASINDPLSVIEDASGKQSISPRVGISFPITDRGIIHFSYGHFYQLPSFSNLYTNPNFETFAGIPTFGNANLNPEKTITYEMGLQQQLTDNIAFNVTGFYKDVRDLLALRQYRISSSSIYYKYANQDYGNIKGIVFSLTKRRTPEDGFGVTLDYTYQTAEGNETNSDAFFLDVNSGRQTEKVPVPLNWDQRHTLNGTVSFGVVNDWNATLVGRIGTGLPYTPEITTRQIFLRSNSERRPSQLTFDLLAEKSFAFSDVILTVFLKIFNLFDNLNERLVYNDTGRSSYTLEENKGAAQATNLLAEKIPGAHSATEYFVRPNYYAPPREVRIGFSIEF